MTMMVVMTTIHRSILSACHTLTQFMSYHQAYCDCFFFHSRTHAHTFSQVFTALCHTYSSPFFSHSLSSLHMYQLLFFHLFFYFSTLWKLSLFTDENEWNKLTGDKKIKPFVWIIWMKNTSFHQNFVICFFLSCTWIWEGKNGKNLLYELYIEYADNVLCTFSVMLFFWVYCMNFELNDVIVCLFGFSFLFLLLRFKCYVCTLFSYLFMCCFAMFYTNLMEFLCPANAISTYYMCIDFEIARWKFDIDSKVVEFLLQENEQTHT